MGRQIEAIGEYILNISSVPTDAPSHDRVTFVNDFQACIGFPANPYNQHAWLVGEPEIADGVWIGPFTVIDGSGGLTIGAGCNVSAGAQIYTHSTAARCVSEGAQPIERRPTTIGNHVYIGANAVILMGAEIGHHCVVGAGAVVLEGTVAPPYSTLVGVPARIIPKGVKPLGPGADADSDVLPAAR